jgi:DNA repair protein RadC
LGDNTAGKKGKIAINNCPEDEKFTRELTPAGKALFISVLDHLLIGDDKYFSFADKGLV